MDLGLLLLGIAVVSAVVGLLALGFAVKAQGEPAPATIPSLAPSVEPAHVLDTPKEPPVAINLGQTALSKEQLIDMNELQRAIEVIKATKEKAQRVLADIAELEKTMEPEALK